MGARGNAPDPKEVSVASGLVKYTLVWYNHITAGTNRAWDRVSFAKDLKAVNQDQRLEGALLVQMLEDRKIRVEYFAGKSAEQIIGFTQSALVYER